MSDYNPNSKKLLKGSVPTLNMRHEVVGGHADAADAADGADGADAGDAAPAGPAPDVSMDDEVMDLSSSSNETDDSDWEEEDEGGDDKEQNPRELIKDLKNRLRVSIQKNKRRGETIQKMKDRPATKVQMRNFLKQYYSQGFTNWILSNRGTLLRKKKGRVTRKWSHTGMSKSSRS